MYCDEIDSKYFVVFVTRTNLETLCNAEIVLMDGTFKSCPKHFYHLYTIHVYVNLHCIPVVCALLIDKT